MAFVKGIFILAALMVAAATTAERRNPQNHGHGLDHGHGHGHGPPAVVPERPDDLTNPEPPVIDEVEIPELESLESIGADETVLELNLHRQRRQLYNNALDLDNHQQQEHEHEHGHEHGHDHAHEHKLGHGPNKPEQKEQEPDNEEPAQENEIEDDDESVVDLKRQQDADDDEQTNNVDGSAVEKFVQWVTCDMQTTPILSCYDCNSRLRCKIIGGKVIPCYSPVKPYCNNGICSAVPSALCV